MKFTWKENTGKFASGASLFVGDAPTPVAGYQWSLTASTTDKNKWTIHVILCSVKDKVPTTEEAKETCEELVRLWFSKALCVPPESL